MAGQENPASRRRAAGRAWRAPRLGHELVAAYANDGEMVIALARIALAAVLLARSFLLQGTTLGGPVALLVERAAGALLAVAPSIWIARRASRRRLGLRAHLLCTLFDSALCFLALRTNVVGASGSYAGLLRMPDSAFVAVVIFASTLRLHDGAIAVAVASNVLSLGWLLRLDHRMNGIVVGWNDLQVVVLQLCAAGGAAFVSAWAVRRAIHRLAVEAARVTRGRRHLDEVLRDHHDVRTLLSAARLQLGYLRRETDAPAAARDERLAGVERAVLGVSEILDGVRSRTFEELALADDIAAIEPEAIVASAVSVARDRFPDTRIETSIARDVPPVLLFGGPRALAHLVVNILVNACEGNGTRRARNVNVRLEPISPAGDWLSLDFADDGPGFPSELLNAPLRGGLTTKADGTGLGLSLIAGIVEASGGSIAVRNLPGGGAGVSLRLRGRP